VVRSAATIVWAHVQCSGRPARSQLQNGVYDHLDIHRVNHMIGIQIVVWGRLAESIVDDELRVCDRD
jgi:hypothetical protein